MKRDSVLTIVRRIVAGAILLVFAVLMFRIGSILRDNHQIEEMVKIHTDTLIIHDTIRIETPKYITKVVLDSILIPVPVTDTITKTDTLYIYVPKEQKYYRDKDYEAWVSGYRPELDSLNIFHTTMQASTTYEIQKKKSSRFSIGIQVGYGIYTYNNIIDTGPYLGVGVSYRLL